MKKSILGILTVLSISCQVTVPGKIDHVVSGTATTNNIISIQIDIPTDISNAFKTTCDNQCKSNTNIDCVKNCTAQETQNYANTLLGFLQQIQSAIKPSPTPVPTP